MSQDSPAPAANRVKQSEAIHAEQVRQWLDKQWRAWKPGYGNIGS